MRMHRVRSGNYAGLHPIFESIKDFMQQFPNATDNRELEDRPYFNPKVYWSDWNEVEINDWVTADDGYILQLLNKRELTNKWNKRTRLYRFAMDTAYQWERADGSWGTRPFYASRVTVRHPGSIGGNKGRARDKYAVYLIKAGMDPYQAVLKAYNGAKLMKNDVGSIAKALLIKYEKEIVESIETLVSKVNDEIKKKTGKDPEDALATAIAKEFKSMTDGSLGGVKDKIAFWKFYMALNMPRSNNKSIEQGSYEIEPPLPITEGQKDESDGD